MKLNWYILGVLLSILVLTSAIFYLLPKNDHPFKTIFLPDRAKLTEGNEEAKKLDYKPYAIRIKAYAKSHSYDTTIFFLADLSLPPGKNRFFVFDLENNRLKYSGLVAHGSGKTVNQTAQFSNTPDSWCSSLGKYKIANKYKGRFGTAFKLVGLDKSNSNAYARAIVLHAYTCVPDREVFPQSICNSLGCPMVSINFLRTLEQEIQQSKKPLLLWIIN